MSFFDRVIRLLGVCGYLVDRIDMATSPPEGAPHLSWMGGYMLMSGDAELARISSVWSRVGSSENLEALRGFVVFRIPPLVRMQALESRHA